LNKKKGKKKDGNFFYKLKKLKQNTNEKNIFVKFAPKWASQNGLSTKQAAHQSGSAIKLCIRTRMGSFPGTTKFTLPCSSPSKESVTNFFNVIVEFS